MASEQLLEVNHLETSFYTHLGEVQAVRDVSFMLNKGEILGIVGESGSGKSVTAYSCMNLITDPGKIKNGEVKFLNTRIDQKTQKEMAEIRGKDMAMIFQDPMTSLNPVFTVENQIVEIIRQHEEVGKQQAQKRAIEMLGLVGIPSPEERIKSYPHQFSGGMRQRAMIAMALSCNPKLLIADEPTTALDVTIQAQILELMIELKEKTNTAIIIITHDLGVVAETCNKVLVMYGGRIMERGTVEDIFHNPKNPYTKGLMKSVPRLDNNEHERLRPIQGSPPDLLHPPQGCPFFDRCEYAMNICEIQQPPEFEVGNQHKSACWLLDKNCPYNV